MSVTNVYKTIKISEPRAYVALGAALQIRLDFLRDQIVIDPAYDGWRQAYDATVLAMNAWKGAEDGEQ